MSNNQLEHIGYYEHSLRYTLWCLDENFIITLCVDEKKYIDSHKDDYV